jgi:hypothetical protein
MKNRKSGLVNEQSQAHASKNRSEATIPNGAALLEKPVGAIFVDALALSAVHRTVTDHSSTTNLTFQPRGSATIFLKDGRYDIDTAECAASAIDSSDGSSVIVMLSPAPLSQ